MFTVNNVELEVLARDIQAHKTAPISDLVELQYTIYTFLFNFHPSTAYNVTFLVLKVKVWYEALYSASS